MKYHISVLFFLCCLNVLFSYQLFIGDGSDLDQHVPCDPFYTHSGAQLIYDKDYFPYGGTINQIAFQFQFTSPQPETYLDSITVFLSESSLTNYTNETDIISLSIEQICFQDTLSADNFQINYTEDGDWLVIDLDIPFSYSATNNLVLTLIENNNSRGSNSDNFLSFLTQEITSLCVIDMNTSIDWQSLPNPVFLRNCLPNTMFDIVIDNDIPRPIFPENSASAIDITSSFKFYTSDLTSSHLILISDNQEIIFDLSETANLISENIYELPPSAPLLPETTYQWFLTSVVEGESYTSDMWDFSTDSNIPIIEIEQIVTEAYSVNLNWNPIFDNRYPYLVYRDDSLLTSINHPSFFDTQVIPGQTYHYQIGLSYIDSTQVFSDLQQVTIPQLENILIYEDFEEYPAFTSDLSPWQNIDYDNSETYSLPGFTYPYAGEKSAFMIFNPQQVSPPLQLNISGNNCLVSFASTNPPTSDFLISPSFSASQIDLSLLLQSYDPTYGYERVKLGLIYNQDFDNYIPITNDDYLEIPEHMTKLNFSHTSPNSDTIITNFYIESCGIQSLMLIIDKIIVSSTSVSNYEQESNPIIDIYPNPISEGKFYLSTNKNISSISLYNIRGQLIKKLTPAYYNSKISISLDRNLPSGVYLLKTETKNDFSIQKICIIK